MADVLSQAEIDALLNAMNSGEFNDEDVAPEKTAVLKDYDFKRPAKFSKEHLRTLETIFDHYARLLSTNLPVYLRKSVQVTVASSETMTFEEYSNALGTPVVLGVVNFQPLIGSVLVEVSVNLAYAVIDRLLGGRGVTLEKVRDFSEIEVIIIERLYSLFLSHLHTPWKNVVEMTPVLERIETNAQFAQIVAPSDMIALVSMTMKIGDIEGIMNVCMPFFTLEDVMGRLNTKYWYSAMRKMDDTDYKDNVESMVKRVKIPVVAVLGKSYITVNQFNNMRLGDMILLDSKIDSEMFVYVGNIKKFTALPGSNKNSADKDKYAVRVTSVIREEE